MTPVVPPALYVTRIRHSRLAPVRNCFEYRSYSWYFDIEAPPRPAAALRPLAYFRAADHLAGPGGTLRERVDAVLAEHDLDCAGGRITALMNARALGYVFDPLTLFWCHGTDRRLRCVLAEVHNTYGERHVYVLRPDEYGRADVAKQFLVSPFNPVEGMYRLSIPEPEQRLAVRITLQRSAQPPFVASVIGHRVPVTTRSILRAQIRAPLSPWLTAVRIRRQGIALWARGVPVVPRQRDRSEDKVPS